MQYISFVNTVTEYTQYSQLSGILSRGMYLIASISGVVIALLWIPIAIGFFSTDENKKFVAYSRAKSAALGTFIFILAVTGAIYGVFNFIITGN
ncbi:MAG: hypothetical protein M1414_05005 [Candidatus Thermoplasmatota archaeon]|jgi:hypothetical protein|nr:hypothetical protein [Candidatus Thermoplasmatota archaeon]MCL5988246.1 hypothetical protein [Candidatus Thermoplasmatota archaeon]